MKLASTFMGFCGHHDTQLFAPVEQHSFSLDRRSAFLFSFRAICYEVHAKEMALRTLELQRDWDAGQPFHIQATIQSYIHLLRLGNLKGLQDAEAWREEYNVAYRSGDLSAFRFYAVRFSDTLPLVSCGAFQPDFDFHGNQLQILTRGDAPFEHVAYCLTVIDGKSVAIFGWFGEEDGPSDALVKSFRALPNAEKSNAAFHLACEYVENTYYRPSWWNAQTDEARDHLITRARSGGAGVFRASDCLSNLHFQFALAGVEQEFSSGP